MSMDLTGIQNQNEYYTNHYFASVFEDNASETLRRWQAEATEKGDKTPWAKLNAVASRYYVLKDQASRLRSDFDLEPIVSKLAFEVLTALGYPITERSAKKIEVEPGVFEPVALEMTKANGAPLLWVMLSRNQSDEDGIMESHRYMTSVCGNDNEETGYSLEKTAEALIHMSNEEMLSKVLFDMDEPPRWVMFIGMNQIALIDRNKWNEKRFLIFQLDDIFGRRETSTLQAMAILLHKESLCPDEGASLLDTLDENSHKHASGVSKDLKYALRECIEMLGNEVVRDMRERQHVGVFGKDLADDLSIQCLRYMYRILFLLFIEAKPELGYAPMKADAYALGYSFESLREIADNVRADSDVERDGFYLKDSLDMLFKLIYDGYPAGKEGMLDDESLQGVFRIDPLKAHIFDPERTALIEKARLHNGVLLEIIDKMSLTRPQKGKRRGRISYSNLGINQLGSVYEALLSYRGFFAEEDLYEVKRSGDTVDDLDVGYFVTERELDQYDEDERVRMGPNPTDPLRLHPKGEFIYRLAGREREKSASYYTPEVLTNCLVKYALKELLEGKTADEILEMTICEPAMGSAAFLNEAVSQMAEAYLSRKEKETGESVPHDQRTQELQRVKMYIADRNVYGIDLNPVAVELAEVSLWLNTIYQGAYVPWFRTQIVNGNSLIGARRQCYTLTQLQAEKGSAVWYENAPERIMPDSKRKFSRQVYHFLTGDPGMCNYTDKVIKAMEPEKLAFIKDWNKKFTRPFSDEECDRVLELSAAIDQLWAAHVQLRHEVDEKTTDPLSVWGQPVDEKHKPLTIREKDKIYEKIYLTEHQQNSGPYARLKAVMDYWCALWFWPIDKAELLPTRQEYIFDMYALLGVDIIQASAQKHQLPGQVGFFDDKFYANMYDLINTTGRVNLDQMRELFPRLRVADEVAKQQHFFHWELEFADVFAERGGFDFIIGNPPWVKMVWNEQAVLGDKQPLLEIKKYSAAKTAEIRTGELKNKEVRELYFSEYESMAGSQSFLSATQNYDDLKGQQTNLFKCFLPQAWEFGCASAVSAFIHPDGVFDDAKGARLRLKLYPKLCYHFKFQNEKQLFDIMHTRTYSLNVYRNDKREIMFDSIFNLYEPHTIDECYDKTESQKVEGTKNARGEWNTVGHPHRIIKIKKAELLLFAKLFEGNEEWRTTSLPVIHARELLDVLRSFVKNTDILENIKDSVFCSEMWHETNNQLDGTIYRDKDFHASFPENVQAMIFSGPHISTANPFSRTPRSISRLSSDYDRIDLEQISGQYLPRSNYSIECPYSEYLKRVQSTPWGERYDELYRLCTRKMLNQDGERTLNAVIIPKYAAHINGLFSIGFAKGLFPFAAYAASLPYDFFLKITKKANTNFAALKGLPLLKDFEKQNHCICRMLLLNCLTEHYALLWKENWKEEYKTYTWTKNDNRLNNDVFKNLSSVWTDKMPLRNDYARRQALVELDVLTAMALGMNIEQLKTIYRLQFSTLQKNESDTWYDAHGRIVFTINASISNSAFDRKTWEKELKGAPAGKKFYRTIMDDTQPGGPVERTIEYVAPFDKCDREKDYETAWEFFSKNQ